MNSPSLIACTCAEIIPGKHELGCRAYSAELLAALRALRAYVDVSTINNSKRTTAQWEQLISMADAAIAKEVQS